MATLSAWDAAHAESVDFRDRLLQFQPEAQTIQRRQIAVADVLSFGRRIGRPTVDNGFQNLIRAEAGATEWLQLGADFAFSADSASNTYNEFGFGAGFSMLDQRRDQPLNLKLDAQGVREHDGTWVAIGAVSISRRFGKWTPTGSVTLEKPFATGRDAVDLIFAMGASYAIRDEGRVGLEATGSDVEALWEAEEAEGGARVVAGPVFAWDFLDRRLSTGVGVVAGVVTLPRPTITGEPAPKSPTVTARGSLTYTFN